MSSAREVIADLAASLDETEPRERFMQAALATLPKEQPLTARQSAKHAFGGLSEREREVVRLVAAGLSNAEIAARLYLSQATIKSHITRILARLGLRDRVQIAVFAYENGIVRPGYAG